MEPSAPRKPVSAAQVNKRHRKRRSASRVTNGALLPGNTRCIDGRSAWCRRLRDLLEAHVSDLGGWDMITASESALLRRAVVLIVECERREAAFAHDGRIDDEALITYQTVANSVRRLLEALGLQRRARDVTPTLARYIAEYYPANEEAQAVEESTE
jgi:hypothetical protein